MSLEKLTAREIIGKIPQMSARPEYYSGRGATLFDLNSEILEKIYQGIEKEYGKEVSNEFVKMVSDLPVASATDFLLNLYKLESNDWKWNKKMLGNEKGIYVDGPTDEVKFAIGMASITGILGGPGNRDDTSSIKYSFLKNHGVKPKTELNDFGMWGERY